jgi:hypothetical protein
MLMAGCGDSGAPSHASSRPAPSSAPAGSTRPPPRAAGDAGIAQLSLMHRQDVPATVVAQYDTRNHARCSPRRLFRRLASGIATTPLYRTDDAEVQESVLLFRDEATAARAFRILDSPAKHRCIRRGVQQDAIRRLRQPMGEPIEQALTVEPTGQQSSSFRLTLPIEGRNASVEVLFGRVGRGLSSTSLVWNVTPRDLVFEEALAAHIARRLERALS